MKLSDIRPRLRVMRRSQADLARHLSIDPSSLVKVLGGVRRLTPGEMSRIETFFGEPLEIEGVVPRNRSGAAKQRIPLFGMEADISGSDRVALGDGQVLDYLDPPPFWNNSADMIYVRVLGDSMEPRYFAGEIVPVRLGLPPGKGQDCLVVFNDDSAIVRTFINRRDGYVFLAQYNERKETPFDATSIAAIHAVWRPGIF